MNFKLTRSDIYILLLYFAAAIPINCFDYADYEDKMDLVFENIMMLFFDTTCIYVIIFIIFPYFFPKRQFVLLLVCAISFFVFQGTLFINIYCFVEGCKGNPMSAAGVYQGLGLVSESFAIPGLLILGKKLYEAQTNFLKIEKEKKESELLRLNAQIDPHFLFNNLNTVDSLIDTNPSAAKVYLNRLSKLYRYLISTKDQEVVELEEELDFAQHYIYLIQSRFGNAYEFTIEQKVEDNVVQFIPPGALQTLLENIVKHNQPSPTVPVRSLILIEKETITIRNNINLGTKKVDSMGTGLNNLKARYELLIDKAVKISTNGHFEVTLPLIKQVD